MGRCVSLRYTMPPGIAFGGNVEEVGRVGAELHRLLDDLGFLSHPLIAHLFSGNGCLAFNALAVMIPPDFGSQ